MLWLDIRTTEQLLSSLLRFSHGLSQSNPQHDKNMKKNAMLVFPCLTIGRTTPTIPSLQFSCFIDFLFIFVHIIKKNIAGQLKDMNIIFWC